MLQVRDHWTDIMEKQSHATFSLPQMYLLLLEEADGMSILNNRRDFIN